MATSAFSGSARKGLTEVIWKIRILQPFLLTLCLAAARSASAAEAIVNGAFDTDRPIVLRGFAAREDVEVSAFPRLLGTSATGVGWFSTIVPDHFELWEPGFFGNPSSFGQHLELAEHATIFQDFTVGATGDALFSFLYTRGLLGTAQFRVSIGLPGADGSNDGSLFPGVVLSPTGSFSDWQTFSASVRGVASGTYRVSFTDATADLILDQPLIDQVSFVAVPEPSSAVLLILAILGSGLLGKRLRTHA
jgi:hypothetical protein